LNLYAQYPKNFIYDDSNGLPSNEVYSIVQDQKGFIWLGCDAGLYKFDGIRYLSYKCQSQKSKSISGLCISSSGRLYCDNFQSQLFYVERDNLKELRHNFKSISHIACDLSGNLLVNHQNGIAVYNENTKSWKNYADFEGSKELIHKNFTKSIRVDSNDDKYFLYHAGIGVLKNERLKKIPISSMINAEFGELFLTCYNKEQWVFSFDKKEIHITKDGKYRTHKSNNFFTLLEGRKVTNIRSLSDGKIWICTYKGVLIYNPQTNKSELLYPEYSFSDCLIDREGNYWLSTLQTGLLRIPNLNFVVWDKSHSMLNNDKITQIVSDGKHIHFSTINGFIGRIDVHNETFKLFHTGIDADIQSLNFINNERGTYFNINKHLFTLHHDKIKEIPNQISAIKSILKVKNTYFIGSSFGTFIQSGFDFELPRKLPYWTRTFEYDAINNIVWAATNQGLFKFEWKTNQWLLKGKYFNEKQILSLDFDDHEQVLYVLTFKGDVYSISKNGEISLVCATNASIQTYRLKYNNRKIYFATNKGVWIYGIQKNKWTVLNVLSGLASDNVQDLEILKQQLWLATGKGLQRIPLQGRSIQKRALIYLKNKFENPSSILLKYGEQLVLFPEISSYSSYGSFEIVYRINKGKWVNLPASIEKIEVQNIPAGDFSIELKAKDFLNRDSENTIELFGYVSPPFWQSVWFLVFIILTIIFTSFLITKKIIANIRKREKEKTALIHSELTALKAQMNPHFMYNALNSIQALILQKDIKNSNLYLSQFSRLMRKVLDVSGKTEISLQEEMDTLSLYLSLEKLRFGDDFQYELNCSNELDSYSIFIPPMLLQPFVENAVKHGLLHKKGDKKLNISFNREKQLLICEIADNGIGRAHAQEIKNRQKEASSSFSTNATQKRIELLNSVDQKNLQIDIIDLYENTNPCGTKVVLKIPI